MWVQMNTGMRCTCAEGRSGCVAWADPTRHVVRGWAQHWRLRQGSLEH